MWKHRPPLLHKNSTFQVEESISSPTFVPGGELACYDCQRVPLYIARVQPGRDCELSQARPLEVIICLISLTRNSYPCQPSIGGVDN